MGTIAFILASIFVATFPIALAIYLTRKPADHPRATRVTKSQLLAQQAHLVAGYNRACRERDVLLRVVARGEGTDIQTARQKHLGATDG